MIKILKEQSDREEFTFEFDTNVSSLLSNSNSANLEIELTDAINKVLSTYDMKILGRIICRKTSYTIYD